MGVIETGYVHRLESSDCNIIRFPVVAPRECAGQEKQRALIFVFPVRCSATQYLNNPYTKEPVCPHISVLRVLRDDHRDHVFFINQPRVFRIIIRIVFDTSKRQKRSRL